MGRVVVRVSDEKRKVDSLGAGEFMSESQHLAPNALFLPGRTDGNGCDSGSGDSFAQQSHRDGCQSRSIRNRIASSALPKARVTQISMADSSPAFSLRMSIPTNTPFVRIVGLYSYSMADARFVHLIASSWVVWRLARASRHPTVVRSSTSRHTSRNA